jgi:hypothetical protein
VPLLRQRHHPFLVLAERQPLEQEGVDLPLQFSGRPASVHRFGFVEGTGFGSVHAQQQAVVGPGQFVTHCVTNWVGQIEGSHIPEVWAAEAFAQFGGEPSRQFLDQVLSVFSTAFAPLLFLDDGAADFPVRAHHRGIDSLPGLGTCA